MRHRLDIRALLALATVVLLTLSLACGGPGASAESGEDDEPSAQEKTAGEKEDGDENGDEEEAVPVEVVTLQQGPIETMLRFSTNLEAENDVQVVSRASRQLQVRQLLVEEGAEVERGDVLLRLESSELRTALARIEGQLAKARREYERQTSLYAQQLISEQAHNDATYELEQLELALEDAQRELGYTEVRAPISGTVTERHVSVGDQVSTNQKLFRIVDFDSIVARVYVPEKDLWRVRKGLEARLYAEANRGLERRGTVDRVAPQVDPRSGTVKVTVAIPRGAGLLPGMYVSVELITAVNAEAVLVPKKALIYDAEQIFVFRLADEDRVERLLIEARLEDRDNIEPAGALAAGDRIVVAGQAGLKDGSLVRLIDEASAEDAGDGGGAGGAAAEPVAAESEPSAEPEMSAELETPAERAPEPAAAEPAVRDWAAAWSDQRVEDYLASYADSFQPPDGQSRQAWAADRRQRIARPSSIQVDIEATRTVELGPDRVSVSFDQSYTSDTFSDRVRKTLVLVWQDGTWKIAEERVIEQSEGRS